MGAVLALGMAAACSPGATRDSEVYRPPSPLAMVVLIDPSSGQMDSQLRQLETVVRANATPREALVVMLLAPGSSTYTVERDDSLSAIAAAHGLTLAEVEAANPQFGPVAGRNWSLIHSGERVTLPDPTAPTPLLLVSKAPDGPPPPTLMKVPKQPSNPTDYQKAQYQHALASATATNDARIATWKSQAAASLAPWQDHVAALLENAAVPSHPGLPDNSALGLSIVAGLATLSGLPGHRLLLVLGGGETVPSLTAGSMSGVDLVVANLADAKSVTAWTDAGKSASAASVSALDGALTQLQLVQSVNK